MSLQYQPDTKLSLPLTAYPQYHTDINSSLLLIFSLKLSSGLWHGVMMW